jgi:D-glutamate cyclase
MAQGTGERAVVEAIERLIQSDVGRNIGPLCDAARGGLWGAACSLAAARPCRVGLITGFYVPRGTPPAAETDGPVGVALLARGLIAAGVPCRLATDEPCLRACEVALAAAGASEAPVDVCAVDASLHRLIKAWRAAGITHALSIERCGRSADGTPRNMRGLDIGSHTAPLDDLFVAGPWQTIAVGDGGNEIGMGALPRGLIAQHVANGETIACVTPAQHLIVAGVSHWGACALLGALARLRPNWRRPLVASLDAELERRVLEAMVAEGPAVDGVSLRQVATIDNLDLATHHQKLRMIRALAEGGHAL